MEVSIKGHISMGLVVPEVGEAAEEQSRRSPLAGMTGGFAANTILLSVRLAKVTPARGPILGGRAGQRRPKERLRKCETNHHGVGERRSI